MTMIMAFMKVEITIAIGEMNAASVEPRKRPLMNQSSLNGNHNQRNVGIDIYI
jgi:hypothetical protein